MPDQIVPITDIVSTGVILDTPSIALPPNAFSDVQNVRFRDGAIRKLPGEGLTSISLTNIVYVAYWPAPQEGRYVVITDNGTECTVHLYDPEFNDVSFANNTIDTTGGNWQHTLFNGGFHIVLNNGLVAPNYLQENIASVQPIPGWDSYLSQEEVTTIEWSGDTFGRILIGRTEIAANERFVLTVTPRNPSNPIVVTSADGPFDVGTQPGVGTFAAVIGLGGNIIDLDLNPANAAVGDTLSIAIQTIPDIIVTAGVVRAYGNLLVAGDLMEYDRDDGTTVRRALPGTIRTSDVAAPGTIPGNWNPFRIGVNTADEFTLAATGRVRDMAELQGVLYVYTDSSIHSVQQTGSPTIPFQIAPVTTSYGANNTGSVLDVDGKHIVVGSDDVYVFAGHPGSISSIADARVRFNPFFDTEVRIVRFQKYDELWFWKPNDTEMFIWNYRDNTWTRRVATAPRAGTIGHDGVYFANASSVFDVDTGFSATPSYIERTRLTMTPEFNVETVGSVALLTSGNGDFNIQVEGTNIPSIELDMFDAEDHVFNIDGDDADYKTDIRVNGRFLNYRITHAPVEGVTDEGFELSGMQFEISKGGTR